MNHARHSREIIDLACRCNQRGWVPAGGGNFSLRVSEHRIAITRSGAHKGELTAQDILLVDSDGKIVEGEGRPSAETGLHLGILRRSGQAGCVAHTHSVAATVLSRRGRDLELAGYEMFKVFDGIETHSRRVSIPVFENDQDIERLDRAVELKAEEGMDIPAYLIAGHGLYTWGATAEATWRQLEALEFLFDCEWMEQQAK